MLIMTDASVMATLTSPITESFSSFHLLTWFINAYTVTSALVQPLSGKLSDIYGRRNCLLWANFAFLVGNALCGIATEPWHFIFGRAVAGLGGGCLHSVSTFLASDIIPLRSRGFWQGVSIVAFGVGFGIGGTLGGFITNAYGWRWVFLAQPLPILLSMILVFCLVPKYTTARTETPSVKRIDFLGSITLTMAILCLMFGAISGGNTLPWSSPMVYVPLALSPVLVAIFCQVEIKVAKEPMIPVQLLANRTILGACLTNLLNSIANTTMMYYVPMDLEVRDYSAARAGIRLLPYAIGAFVGSVGAGALMNITGRYWRILFVSQIAMLAASTVFLVIPTDSSTDYVSFIVLLVIGLGMGGSLITTLLALISAADHKHQAVLTSVSYAFRTTGNVLGTTAAGAIFQNVLDQQLWSRFGDKRDAGPLIPAVRRRKIDIDDLPRGWKEGVLQSYAKAFLMVFIFVVAVYVAASITASIIRENRLHKTLKRSEEPIES